MSVWFQNDLAPLAAMSGPSQQYRGQNASFSGASSLDSYSDIGTLNYHLVLRGGNDQLWKNGDPPLSQQRQLLRFPDGHGQRRTQEHDVCRS